MEEGDSQFQYVGPLSAGEDSPATSEVVQGTKPCCWTHVSIKNNKQFLAQMYKRFHANSATFLRSNSLAAIEVQLAIKTIVEVLEKTDVRTTPDGFDLVKIAIFLSNMILCVDASYKEDFFAIASDLFKPLSDYFCEAIDRQIEGQSKDGSSYQAMVLIYKLLMGTRQAGCKHEVIAMREKLINKKFMRKIFELDVEEFTPHTHTTSETSSMLPAFHSLFAKKKEKIVQFNLARLAKDAFLEGLERAKTTTGVKNVELTHKALGCIYFTFDALKLTQKDVQKYPIVPIICDLLDDVKTTTAQAKELLFMLIAFSQAKLINAKPAHLTQALGVAFKAFDKAPVLAMRLASLVFAFDAENLKYITLHMSLSLTKNLTMRWADVVGARRSVLTAERRGLPQSSLQLVQLRIAQGDVEERLRCVVELLTVMTRSSVSKSISQQIAEQLDALLFPLRNSLELTATSWMPRQDSPQTSQSQSPVQPVIVTKVEEEEEVSSEEESAAEHSSTAATTIINSVPEQPQPQSATKETLQISFNPPCLQLYVDSITLIELLLRTCDDNASIRNKLNQLTFSQTLRSIYECLHVEYRRLLLTCQAKSEDTQNTMKYFTPFITVLTRTLKMF